MTQKQQRDETWQPRSVTDQRLDLYGILKWAGADQRERRVAFLRSKEAKERRRPALAPGNIERTMTALLLTAMEFGHDTSD